MPKMPPGGVNQLLKTPSGRRLLARMQKIHAKDILQPSDPLFKKVWGKKLALQAENRRKAIDAADAAWERHQYEKLLKSGVSPLSIKVKRRPWDEN